MEFRSRDWHIPADEDEGQADLCPGCTTRVGLDPDSMAKREARRAVAVRELNGIPLYSYAELGMSEAVL